MPTRKSTRLQKCSATQAAERQQQAQKFFEVAEIAFDERDEGQEYGAACASLAVLAAIAASDAACCKAMGVRSRGQSHHEAERLLASIPNGGAEATKELRLLLNLKDAAHYGFSAIGSNDLKRAIRAASKLIAFSGEVLNR